MDSGKTIRKFDQFLALSCPQSRLYGGIRDFFSPGLKML